MAVTKKSRGAGKIWTALLVLTAILVAVGVYLSVAWAPSAANLPTEAEQLAQRIF